MASITSTKGLSQGDFGASVCVHHRPLPCYQIQRLAKSTITCYIESVGGAQFSVVHLNDGTDPSTSHGGWDISTYLDGVKVGGVVYGPDSEIYRVNKGVAREQELRGYQNSSTTYQPFLFGQKALTEDQTVAVQDDQMLEQLGTIQVRVCRVTQLQEEESELYHKVENKWYEESSEIVKQISHQTKLAPPLAAIPESRASFKLVDPITKPYLTFEFKYRSRAILEKLGVLTGLSSGLSSVSDEEEGTPFTSVLATAARKQRSESKSPELHEGVVTSPSSPSVVAEQEGRNDKGQGTGEGTSSLPTPPKEKKVAQPQVKVEIKLSDDEDEMDDDDVVITQLKQKQTKTKATPAPKEQTQPRLPSRKSAAPSRERQEQDAAAVASYMSQLLAEKKPSLPSSASTSTPSNSTPPRPSAKKAPLSPADAEPTDESDLEDGKPLASSTRGGSKPSKSKSEGKPRGGGKKKGQRATSSISAGSPPPPTASAAASKKSSSKKKRPRSPSPSPTPTNSEDEDRARKERKKQRRLLPLEEVEDEDPNSMRSKLASIHVPKKSAGTRKSKLVEVKEEEEGEGSAPKGKKEGGYVDDF